MPVTLPYSFSFLNKAAYDATTGDFTADTNGNFTADIAEASTEDFTSITIDGAIGNPDAMVWNGTNFVVLDDTASEIYELDGTGTIVSTTAFPVEITEVGDATWDGTNLWVVGNFGQGESLVVRALDSNYAVVETWNTGYTVNSGGVGGGVNSITNDQNGKFYFIDNGDDPDIIVEIEKATSSVQTTTLERELLAGSQSLGWTNVWGGCAVLESGSVDTDSRSFLKTYTPNDTTGVFERIHFSAVGELFGGGSSFSYQNDSVGFLHETALSSGVFIAYFLTPRKSIPDDFGELASLEISLDTLMSLPGTDDVYEIEASLGYDFTGRIAAGTSTSAQFIATTTGDSDVTPVSHTVSFAFVDTGVTAVDLRTGRLTLSQNYSQEMGGDGAEIIPRNVRLNGTYTIFNDPPTVDAIVIPAEGGLADDTVPLTATVSDPDGHDVYATWQIQDDVDQNVKKESYLITTGITGVPTTFVGFDSVNNNLLVHVGDEIFITDPDNSYSTTSTITLTSLPRTSGTTGLAYDTNKSEYWVLKSTPLAADQEWYVTNSSGAYLRTVIPSDVGTLSNAFNSLGVDPTHPNGTRIYTSDGSQSQGNVEFRSYDDTGTLVTTAAWPNGEVPTQIMPIGGGSSEFWGINNITDEIVRYSYDEAGSSLSVLETISNSLAAGDSAYGFNTNDYAQVDIDTNNDEAYLDIFRARPETVLIDVVENTTGVSSGSNHETTWDSSSLTNGTEYVAVAVATDITPNPDTDQPPKNSSRTFSRFTLGTPNLSPNKPTIITPTEGSTETSPVSIEITYSDPDGDPQAQVSIRRSVIL